MILLNTNNVQQSSTPDFVLGHAQFEVFTEPAPLFAQNHIQRDEFPQIGFQELVSPTLRYPYTFASSPWHNYLMERLQRWVWVELFKLEPGKRPG